MIIIHLSCNNKNTYSSNSNMSPKLLLSHSITHYKSIPEWKANLSRLSLIFLFILLNSQGILEKGIFRRPY